MSHSNVHLAHAFPKSLRDDALQAASALPPPSWKYNEHFSVRVDNENVSIPYRIYHDPAFIDTARLTTGQTELLDCLLTRHHSGFVREKHLARIICCHHDWIPPFVVQLVGEYVIQILHVIQTNLCNLDTHCYQVPDGQPHFFRNHETASHKLLGLLLPLAAQGRLPRFPNLAVLRPPRRQTRVTSLS